MSSVNVLLVTTNYWPEPTGIAIYTTDLANLLKSKDYQITVLTGLPHYPWWEVPQEFSNLVEGSAFSDGIQVIRAEHIVPPKMNALHRMRFEFSLWRNLKRVSNHFVHNRPDVIIACIPTVAAGMIGKRIAKSLKVPFGLIVQDLSGVGAKQSGIRGGTLLSKFALFLEETLIKSANSVVVVSPSMLEIVLGLGVYPANVIQIANYGAKNIENLDRDEARRSFGWVGSDFLVLHTGNMGAKQDLENVVEAAKLLMTETKTKIYLVGHGNQEENLRKMCAGLDNITVMDAVRDDQYSALLSAADLLLVNERDTQMEMSLPSKLTSYLYSERPVLAAVPRGGATWKFLDGISELVEAGKPSILACAISELSQNPEKRNDLASKGLEFARKNLGAEIGRRKYFDWVNTLIQSKRD